MTNIKRDGAARKRGELNRETHERLLSPAINARRRVNAPRPSAAWNRARQAGRGDSRFAYLSNNARLGKPPDASDRCREFGLALTYPFPASLVPHLSRPLRTRSTTCPAFSK